MIDDRPGHNTFSRGDCIARCVAWAMQSRGCPHDDLALQHVEYVPRVVRRRSLAHRMAIAVVVALVATFVLHAFAFSVANPDSYELAPNVRAARREWLRIVTAVGSAAAFAIAVYWQWPRRRRDRDGVPMPVPTKDMIEQLRHRRQLA